MSRRRTAKLLRWREEDDRDTCQMRRDSLNRFRAIVRDWVISTDDIGAGLTRRQFREIMDDLFENLTTIKGSTFGYSNPEDDNDDK